MAGSNSDRLYTLEQRFTMLESVARLQANEICELREQVGVLTCAVRRLGGTTPNPDLQAPVNSGDEGRADTVRADEAEPDDNAGTNTIISTNTIVAEPPDAVDLVDLLAPGNDADAAIIETLLNPSEHSPDHLREHPLECSPDAAERERRRERVIDEIQRGELQRRESRARSRRESRYRSGRS
jgi:hypothetical protein